MGGQQSVRRVSYDNEEPNNLIKVSEKVVERLKGSVEESKPSDPPRSQIICPPRAFKEPTNEDELPPPVNKSLEIEKQYQEEIRKNNQHWEDRIKSLKESHERINNIWNAEYKKAIEDVDKSFPRIPPKNGEVPCSDKKTSVISCYKKNKDQPLNCAAEVQAFNDCVNNVRIQLQSEDKI